MARVIIIGAGGVGRVVIHTCAKDSETFEHIMLASRTLERCEEIAASIDRPIETAQVDADSTEQLVELFSSWKPDLVINVALPYQDLTIMDACLETGVHYLDTANYEPMDEAKFEYSWQWAYQDRFKKAGLTALLGSGFDPGVTNVFTAYAAKHYFDEIHELNIIDVNAGSHGYPFATNFNPEINIREVSAVCRHWEDGTFVETPAMSKKIEYTCPDDLGTYTIYRMYHEELESLVKNFPTLKRAQFWMSFSQKYLNHLEVLQNVGMTSIKPIEYEGKQIVPIQFLKAVLPKPSELGSRTTGETCIGCIVSGIKDGKEKKIYIYNICSHQKAYEQVGSQAISYTTGVPAMIGAKMVLDGHWVRAGVNNMETFDPDPFMDALNTYGLPWNIEVL
jgi:saccharopine dehydrogenase (NAD+, L-lysine-forming)